LTQEIGNFAGSRCFGEVKFLLGIIEFLQKGERQAASRALPDFGALELGTLRDIKVQNGQSIFPETAPDQYFAFGNSEPDGPIRPVRILLQPLICGILGLQQFTSLQKATRLQQKGVGRTLP